MSNPGFNDHFSGHAADYASHRPGYPATLFEWLTSVAPCNDAVWDCATGSGQAAVGLANHFAHVWASDASAAMIAAATPHPKVTYLTAPAEACGLPDNSVSLVTVAQALHWFDVEAFDAEVHRVAVSGSAFVAWCYGLAEVRPDVDGIIRDFYRGPIHEHWPVERRHIESGYQSIRFPFEPIEVPELEMTRMWRVGDMLAYLRTWSAVKRMMRASTQGQDPVDAIECDLVDAWGAETRAVRWPLTVLAGRVA